MKKTIEGGLLFVIEGIDGSLKATNTTSLVLNLRELGYDVQQREFPRYTHPAAFTTERYLNGDYLNSDGSKATSPMASSICYTADRIDAYYGDEHYLTYAPELNMMVPAKVKLIAMKKHFDQGGIAVSDRWTTANIGHQAGKAKTEKEWEEKVREIEYLEYEQAGLKKPTAVFIVDMPPEIGYRLGNNTKSKYTPGQDIHAGDIQHLRDASTSFIKAANKLSEQGWHVINPLREGVDRQDYQRLTKAPITELIRDKKNIAEEIFTIAKTYLN